MLARCNKHIKKFNQLVEVHDPDGIDKLETISSREREKLRQRLDGTAETRVAVEALTAEEFFDDREQTQIEEAESMPAPSAAATARREELLDRLDHIEDALDDAIDGEEVLDASDDISF